jgi:hypothetical protein
MTLRRILIASLFMLTVASAHPTWAASPDKHGIITPNVVGLTLAAAKKAIEKADLEVGRVSTQSSATVAAGHVISENPPAGTRLKDDDTKVSLVVSSGSPLIAVPNVVGLTQAAATTAITGASLTVGAVTTQTSTTVAFGAVISENPAASALVAAASTVNLTISAGVPIDLTAMLTTTSLAPDVPAIAAQAITQVLSSADVQPVGTALTIPTNSVGISTPIFALDANQNLILAAYANSASTTLSATSTATVLTLFTIGLIPPTGPTFAQVVQDVQSTAGFAPLVAAITTSITAGTPPLQSPAVTQAVAVVVNQSYPLIAAQTTAPVAAAAQIRAAAVIPPTQVTTMLPFQIFGPSATFPRVQSVYVSSAAGGVGGVNLVNSMPIAWSAGSTDQNGGTLDAGKTLGAVNPILALVFPPFGVTVSGNGQEFTLTVAQTAATRDANVKQSIADLLGFLIGQLGFKSANIPTCTLSATNNVLTAAGSTFETLLINEPTGVKASLLLSGSLAASIVNNGIKEALNCALPAALSQSADLKLLVQLGAWVNPTTTIWKTISAAVSFAGPANETAVMFYYWNASQSVGICEAASTVVNCAASFQIASPANFLVGATTTLGIRALDVHGLATPYSSYKTLIWNSTNQAVATVQDGGIAGALAQGATTVSATDLYTGATGAAVVTVSPLSSPPPAGNWTLIGMGSVLSYTTLPAPQPGCVGGNCVIYVSGTLSLGTSGAVSNNVQCYLDVVNGNVQRCSTNQAGETWSATGTANGGAINYFSITYPNGFVDGSGIVEMGNGQWLLGLGAENLVFKLN